MPLLTIFTAPKPFKDPHIATIQRNAIQSWLKLGEDVEVILVGDESGMAEVAEEFGIPYFPEVRRNASGTPLVSSIFQIARQASKSPLLAYLNGDIIALPDLVETSCLVADQLDAFLIVGQRWNLEVQQEIDFNPGWVERLRAELVKRGHLYPPTGSDYFVFPKSLYLDIPDFAIGRAGWDNWMIYHARKSGWAAVDATNSITVIHQNHDYSHLPGGQPHYKLEESLHNTRLGGGASHIYTILETDKVIVDGRIRRASITIPGLIRRLELRLTEDDPSKLRWFLLVKLQRLRQAVETRL